MKAASLVVCAGALSVVAGCAPALESASGQWAVTLTDPAPVQNPQTQQFEIEWCPALYFNKTFDPLGQPVASSQTVAPNNVTITLGVENEDIYTLDPFSNPAEFGGPLVFDIGPVGTFYERGPSTFQVSGGGASPNVMNVERRLVDGEAAGSDEFSLVLEYSFDCGGEDEVTRDTVTCDCGAKRLSIDAVATAGPVFR